MSDFIDFFQEDPAFWKQLLAGDVGEGELEGDASAGSGTSLSTAGYSPLHSLYPDFTRSHEAHHFSQLIPCAAEQDTSLKCVELCLSPPAFGSLQGDSSEATSLSPVSHFNQSLYGHYSMIPQNESISPVQRLGGITNGSSRDPSPFSSHAEIPNIDIAVPLPRNINFDANANFRFVSGAIPVDNRSIKEPNQKTSPNTNTLRCEHPSCRSRRTFKRKYELQRHMNKHDGKKVIPCPVEGCDRSCDKPFYRIDKLAHHLKTAHNDDENCLCSVSGCRQSSLSFDLAKIHVWSHWPESDVVVRALRLVGGYKRQCRLGNCEKWIPVSKMQDHLRNHTGPDRLRQTSILLEMGYDAATCNIICPICSHASPDHEAFASHMDFHGARSNDHLVAFWNHMKNIVADFGRRMPDILEGSWKLGHIRKCDSRLRGILKSTTCPFCGDSVGSLIYEDYFSLNHHLKVLEDCPEIKPFRRKVLRVYPGFKEHPIFNDILPVRGCYHIFHVD